MHRKLVHAVRRIVGRRPAKVTKVAVAADAPPGKLFFVFGGSPCKNLNELSQALQAMSDEQYVFHTVPRGNDFARWVKEVLGQSRLATRLEKAKNRREAADIIVAHGV